MEQCFGAAFRLACDGRLSVGIDENKIVWTEVAFVFAAGGEEQSKGFAFDDDAVVARSPKRPASGPEVVADMAQAFDGFGVRGQRIHGELGVSSEGGWDGNRTGRIRTCNQGIMRTATACAASFEFGVWTIPSRSTSVLNPCLPSGLYTFRRAKCTRWLGSGLATCDVALGLGTERDRREAFPEFDRFYVPREWIAGFLAMCSMPCGTQPIFEHRDPLVHPAPCSAFIQRVE
jgi:hypothetical protein